MSRKNHARLLAAAQQKDTGTMKDLLTNGGISVDVSSNTKDKETVLMYCAKTGWTDGVKCLLSHGADPTKTDKNGNTAMLVAAIERHMDVVKVFIVNGVADVTAENKEKKTVKSLLGKEWKNLEKDKVIKEILTKKITDPLLHWVDKGGSKDVRTLCEMGAVNVEPSLIQAATTNKADMVECLIQHGADVDCPTDKGSILTSAAGLGDLDVVKVLVKAGADINAQDEEGHCALWEAWSGDHVTVLEYLANNGADLELQVKNKYLLIECARLGDIKSAEILLDAGANLECVGAKHEGTPLCAAIRQNQREMVEFLLSRGADVNYKADLSLTPLIMACLPRPNGEAQDVRILKALLEKGTDIEHRCDTGRTAFQHAFYKLLPEHVQVLLEAGTKQTDFEDEYPLLNQCGCAGNPEMKHKCVQMFRHLLKHQSLEERSEAFLFGITYTFSMDFLTLFVEASVVPYKLRTPHPHFSHMTPFLMALSKMNTVYLKYLTSIFFISSYDFNTLRKLKHDETLGDSILGTHEEFINSMLSQPWSLSNLTFMAVSDMFGYDSARPARVASSGLPPCLQAKLMFQSTNSNHDLSDGNTEGYPDLTVFHGPDKPQSSGRPMSKELSASNQSLDEQEEGPGGSQRGRGKAQRGRKRQRTAARKRK